MLSLIICEYYAHYLPHINDVSECVVVVVLAGWSVLSLFCAQICIHVYMAAWMLSWKGEIVLNRDNCSALQYLACIVAMYPLQSLSSLLCA